MGDVKKRCPSARAILLAAVKEESRDVELLSAVWHSWAKGPAKAETVLTNFLAAQGGTAATEELAALYRERPWLLGAIPNLRNFCEESERLKYLPRSGITKARIALTDIPMSTGL